MNETGGKALLRAIREMAKWVDDKLRPTSTCFAQQPALGTSNGANAMKPYVQDVATDQEGFLTSCVSSGPRWPTPRQGVIGAMKNYDNIRARRRGNFRVV